MYLLLFNIFYCISILNLEDKLSDKTILGFQMKKFILPATFLIFCMMFLAFCKKQTVSLEVTLDGKTIVSCSKVRIGELSPENGGYRFDCAEDSTSVYVIYDTINQQFKGSVKYIWFDSYKSRPERLKTVYAWYYKLKDGGRRVTEKNIPKRIEQFKKNIFGRIKHGSYEFNLSEPDKKIVFILGSPVK